MSRFLLAQLRLESLIGKGSREAIRTALQKLPTGPKTYDHAYKEAMERIEGQVINSRELAKQALSWITCARRPLTTSELRHALAVEVDKSTLNKESLPEIRDIISMCAGLVTVDEKSQIIRLVHYTTQEYFDRTWTSWFPKAQIGITKVCVTYLLFEVFNTGFCPTDKEFKARLQSSVLYDYAAQNWGYHARTVSINEEQLILRFLESEAKVSACSQAMVASKTYSGDSQYVPRKITGLHLAAYFGLRDPIIALLKNGHNPDLKESYGRTPLSYAAERGHEEVVKLLLAKFRVNPDSKSNNERTPLSYAAERGHEAVVKLLLAKYRVNPNFRTRNGLTSLSWAVEGRNAGIVKLLLAKSKVNVFYLAVSKSD